MDNLKMAAQFSTFAKNKLERIEHSLSVVDSDLTRLSLCLKVSPTSKRLNRKLARKLKHKEHLLNAMVHAMHRVDCDRHNQELVAARKAMTS